MNNWLKLNRSILTSSVFDNPKLLKVWIWCLCKASHKPHDQVVGQQVQHLEAGQFIFGRHTASEELKIPESTVNDYMKLLQKMQNINIKSNNKYSVVTVENWALYQGDHHGFQQQIRQQTDNKPTTNRQQTDTNKKGKKGKKDRYSYMREEIRRRSEKALEEINNGSKD